ncbi:hypothetical protein PVK06_012114 [Gossypium arboreum]|uniref:Uncharacterized protein n=1 Tax=Gossypium arboreum TaxID=29729 RepID=A0ABR0QAZ8_GOSAR|nr:hypothetical protein PVK06_012114 [Gossypium arboreum]
MPSSHGTIISLERMVLLYSILTRKTIDVGKIILRGVQNCAVKRSGLAHFLFTITILCLKAKILANVRKIGYSQGTIMDWDLYRVAGNSVLQKRVKVSEEPEDPDEEEGPTIAQPSSPDLRDELSKLMDLMQHMQW